jgi:Tol biopolymer transport system component
VCALYDVGRAEAAEGGFAYLVMERLTGETLAERLRRGPLPGSEAVALGIQLASALAAAHARGIVHRDLKPGNVMLTRAGAKLLDFGLARSEDAVAPADLERVAETLPTAESPLTREGALAGTWPYLSPEQLLGRPADARSDVFALGCVLFEAVAGRRAFPGATAAEVGAQIVADDRPDLAAHAPAAPPALAALVGQCLARDPADRWQCADDVARGLRLVEASRLRSPAPRESRRWRRLALGSAIVAVSALAVAAFLLSGRRAPKAPVRFGVTPAPGVLHQRPTAATTLAVSPDGRLVVSAGSAGGVTGLWLWSALDGEVRPLENTVGAVGPFFSPDAREVGFFTGGELRRVPLDGGPATTVLTAARGSSGTWSEDGTILFVRPFPPEAGIYSVPARGGEARALLRDDGPSSHWCFPRALPGGRHFLVLGGFGKPVEERQACVASIEGGEPQCFASCHSQAEYSGSGRVLCVRSGTLVAIPFDAAERRTSGEPVSVTRDVRWFGPSGAAGFAVSADGSTLVYEPALALSRLVWFDRDGHEIGVLGEPGAYGLLQIAPDGRRVAVDVWDAERRGRDVWSLDADTGVATRLTAARIDAYAPVWSADGTRLAFANGDDRSPDIAVLRLDGSGRQDWLVRAPGIQIPRHWSRDGRLVAYDDHATGGFGGRQLWLAPADGEPRQLAATPFNSSQGRFSPDGRTLAYVSDSSGRPEVYLGDPEGNRLPRRVSRAGGVLPRFRGDGRELFYFQPDGMMMALRLSDEAATPEALFHIEGVTAFDFDFDVTRDGQRFLVRHSRQAEGAAGLRVVMER